MRVFCPTACLPCCSGQQRRYPSIPTSFNCRLCNIDIVQTSIFGLPSGAYMAEQYGVAYSSIIKGVGIMASGPYSCAKDDLQTAQTKCMAASSPINVNDLIRSGSPTRMRKPAPSMRRAI